MNSVLSNIRIILVETSHPGNIGAAARAMKNMGLSQLYLVNPKMFPHVEATARAAGSDDILAKAIVVEVLQEALVDCTLVVGSSARLRTLPVEVLTPRACAERIVREAQTKQVALLFGRESNGLSNEELQLCHCHMHVPTVKEFSSLNVASTVLLMAYEIKMIATVETENTKRQYVELATADEMMGFYRHLKKSLVKLEFLNPRSPKRLMFRLQRLFNRARVERTELNILRGILSAIDEKIE